MQSISSKVWMLVAILTIYSVGCLVSCSSNDDNPTIEPEPIVNGVLPGCFTVSARGLQVQFSQGNLQYKASTHTWRFAEHQYDIVGGAAESDSTRFGPGRQRV